jgi:serine/threonine protein kinase
MSSTYSSDSFIDWTNKVFERRYILIKKLDYGSYASVWIAYDAIDTKYYALKIGNRGDYKASVRESSVYEAIKNINCQHLMKLVRTFDHISDDDEDAETKNKHHCCVLDLMACSMYKLLKTNQFSTGISFDIVIKCAKQVLIVLKELHKNNIIHGDVKPENMLISGNSLQQLELFDKLGLSKIKCTKKVKGRPDLKTILNEILKKNKKSLEESSEESDDESEDDPEDSDTDDEQISISSCSKSVSSENTEDSNGEENNELVSKSVIENISIKLTDMGGSVLPGGKKRRHVQTSYYRSSELLLGLDYDTSSDIWALGCSIIELLTGKILFNPDSYDGNTVRHHLFLIIKKLGKLPDSMMKESPKRDIFFSHDLKRIKGHKSIDTSVPLHSDIASICVRNNCNKQTTDGFTDLILGMLCYSPSGRITADMALEHHVFSGV